MSTPPPAAPQAPEKPIPSKKWALYLALLMIGLIALIDAVAGLHFGHQAPKPSARAHTPAGALATHDFEVDTRQQLETMRRSKKTLRDLVEKFGSIDWNHVSPAVPVCNRRLVTSWTAGTS